MKKLSHKVQVLNPKLARALLEKNKRNRNVSSPIVLRYRRDMEMGNWDFAADPIRFDQDGNLLDGQHRLLALSKCPEDLHLPFLVVEGLNQDSQLVMDQGRKRTTGQQLSMLGIPNGMNVAAGVRLYLLLVNGRIFNAPNEASIVTSTAAVESWVAENRDIVDGLNPLISAMRSTDALPSVCYAAAIAFYQIDKDLCGEFFRLLNVGAGEGNPINALDKRLQRDRRNSVVNSSRDLLGMFFHTWNLWVKGKSSVRIQKPKNGYTPENFPEPISE